MSLTNTELFRRRYQIIRPLAEGGAATTYLASDKLRDTHIALKLLKLASQAGIESFKSEFSLLCGLFHPHLAQVHDFGVEVTESDDNYYYTSEFIKGNTLDLHRSGLEWSKIKPLMVNLLEAIDFLHRVGFRHGDVKPQNILVDPSGSHPRCVLVDLGCSAPLDQKTTDVVSGTPGFMPPEILEGRPAGRRSDLFSFGVTLATVVEGKTVPKDVGNLISRLTSEDFRQRPANVDEVLEIFGLDRVRLNSASPPSKALRLFGRESEMAEFDKMVSALSQQLDSPRAMLFCGPKGVGKTRLVQEMKWKAQLAGDVLEGGPFGSHPFSDLLCRAIGEEISPDLSGVIRCLEHLSKRKEPLVIVFDDADRLDPAEQDLFYAFLRLLEPSHPVFFIASLTDRGDFPIRSDLVSVVHLEPLDTHALSLWAKGAVSRVNLSEFLRLTGGYPSYVEMFLTKLSQGHIREDELGSISDRDDETLLSFELRSLGQEQLDILGLFAAFGGLIEAEALEFFSVSDVHLGNLWRLGILEKHVVGWALVRSADASAVERTFGERQKVEFHVKAAEFFEHSIDTMDAHQSVSRSARSALLCFHLFSSKKLKKLGEFLKDHRNDFTYSPKSWLRFANAVSKQPNTTDLAVLGAEIFKEAGHPDRALSLLKSLSTNKEEGTEDSGSQIERLIGQCLLELGRTEEAQQVFENSLKNTTNDAERSRLLERISSLLIQTGNSELALDRAREALDIAQSEQLKAQLNENAGIAASYLGGAELARHHLNKAIAFHSSVGSPRNQSKALSFKAIVEFREGNIEAATEGYRKALDIAEQAGISDLVAGASLNLGTACQQRGDWGPALDYYSRGLKMAVALGRVNVEISLMSNLANLFVSIGLFHRGQNMAQRALDAARKHGLRYFEAGTTVVRAEIAFYTGKFDRAIELSKQARQLFVEQKAVREVVEQELFLATVALSRDSLDEAAEHLNNVVREGDYEEAFDVSLRIAMVRGHLHVARGEGSEAMMILEDAKRLASSRGLRAFEAEISALLARSCEIQGAHDLAQRHVNSAKNGFDRVAASLPVEFRDDFWQHPIRANVDSVDSPPASPPQNQTQFAPTGFGEINMLKRFFEINSRLNSTLSVDKVLEHAMDTAIELTGAERGFILLLSDVGSEDFDVSLARNLDHERVGRSHLKFSRGIAEKVIETERPLLAVDAQHDDRFSGNMSVHSMKLKSVASVPIRSPSGILGALYLDNRFERGRFQQSDIDLLMAFSDQVAIALTNARLHAALERRTHELEAEKAHVEELLQGQASEIDRLTREVRARQEVLEYRYDYSNIVGRSEPMKALFEKLDQVIDSPLNVLIQGESGTGKELIARAIHFNGSRRGGRFVTLNCAALPETLMEVELFGSVRGAYTGADRDREGHFVAARGGTLFLDEIGEMPPSMQVKLLRVLQEKEVVPIGSSDVIPVDVRVVCATNRKLLQEVAAHRFREDLYYRIAVVELHLPPLRQRLEDIPILAEFLLDRLAKSAGEDEKKIITPSALRVLLRYPWPGNIRQLENVLARALILTRGNKISPSDIELPKATPRAIPAKDRKEFEREEAKRIINSLQENRWNVSAVSRILGIPRNTLYRKLKKYNISPKP